jgi:hypothetical protein
MVISDRGIAATSQTLASQAGAQILARGGSAIDAAIAANATLGVVEPERGGIGGDLFVIYYEAKTGKLTGINASGWAPKVLTIDFLKSQGNTKMPELGIQAVTVPGCVDGWAKLQQRFGKLPWKDVLAPAIYYAKNGFPVTEIIHETWHEELKKLANDVGGRRVYVKNGETPKLGEIAKNPELGAAMELIAAQGPSAFYKGAIAKAILKTSDRLGGSQRVFQRMGAAGIHRISRVEGLRVAAERPRHRPVGDAQHPGAISLVDVPVARRAGIARADRGAEVDLRGPASLPGRSAREQGAGGRPDLDGVRQDARGDD